MCNSASAEGPGVCVIVAQQRGLIYMCNNGSTEGHNMCVIMAQQRNQIYK